MKTWIIIALGLVLFTSCGGLNSLNTPAPDNTVYGALSQIVGAPTDTALQLRFKDAYTSAVIEHMNNIRSYQAGSMPDKWEKVLREYSQLNQLADKVGNNAVATRLVNIQDYNEAYANAKEKAVESLYDRASNYLNIDDRKSAMEAYRLLSKANELIPGYKDIGQLMQVANERSILEIVINPVNYYNNSYSYYGLNNDFMQYQFVNDLRYQLGSTNNVRVFTDREAYQNKIYPDRVVDMQWNELYMPAPTQNTVTKQVSSEVVTGKTTDGKPVYTTVFATLFITQRFIEARGSLSVRITDPKTNRILMYEDFPGGFTTREEYATYRGDSRALSAYNWAMINNNRNDNPTRNSLFNEVMRQVYPQLINRIKSVTWYN